MNYMEQVAQMLEIKIGEEFRIVNDSYLYKLDDKGLYFLANDDKWKKDYLTLTRILNGKAMIIKKPMLYDVEREYLSAFIKPFRDMVISVIKYESGIYEYIEIRYRGLEKYIGTVSLPSFKKDTMYKGMEIGKAYSLNELGL